MDTQNFYHDLKPFSDFADFTNTIHYQSLPEDWFIFISDIKGSTRAIEEGRYKEVNLIGAASITMIISTLKGFDFPFVFGGDGSSLCVPPDKVPLVELELGKLANLSEKNYGLQLRIAKIPAKLIYEGDKGLFIAKFQITEGRSIALFRGGGLETADRLAKDQYDQFKIPKSAPITEELTGISCRWNPIPSKNGFIISLLVMAQDPKNNESYSEVIKGIQKILNSKIEEANPIKNEEKSYKGLFEMIKGEASYHHTFLSLKYLLRFMEIIAAWLIFKLKLNILFFAFNSKRYSESMAAHSDFRKFDDTLRLILDCTDEQVKSLRDFLQKSYQEEKVFFGMFTSKNALMTCFVEDLNQGNHLHFVDGGDGGFAMAAKELKAQLKKK